MIVALFACRTQATLAGAVTMLKCLPEKLNPVIKPLMESIKKEENEQLQVCFEGFCVWCLTLGVYICLYPALRDVCSWFIASSVSVAAATAVLML